MDIRNARCHTAYLLASLRSAISSLKTSKTSPSPPPSPPPDTLTACIEHVKPDCMLSQIRVETEMVKRQQATMYNALPS